ncbi:PLD nuclease N-terminal domain-containing protein [Gimesia sp.]
MLIDCVKYEPSTGNEKIIWVLVIVLLNGIGALLYYIIRRPERIKQTGQ